MPANSAHIAWHNITCMLILTHCDEDYNDIKFVGNFQSIIMTATVKQIHGSNAC